MNPGQQVLEIFQLEFTLQDVEGEGLRGRALYRTPGLSAGLTLWPEASDLQALLDQIEAQYHDFEKPLDWSMRQGKKRMRLTWGVDALGHIGDGRVALEDEGLAWSVSGRLHGDQSYLPRIAMGLQLLLRA
jgi:hypothetical protein